MPKPLSSFGAVSTRYHQYVIILGGVSKGFVNYSDDIFIYNVHNQCFKKSDIKCPNKGQFHEVITNDVDRENINTRFWDLSYNERKIFFVPGGQ